MSGEIRSFREDLNQSLQTTVPIPSILKAFNPQAKIIDCRFDSRKQKEGTDWEIHLPGGDIKTVDDKIRSRAYSDIAIEWLHESDDGQNKWQGWIYKSPNLDFLLYLWEPLRSGYLIDFQQMRDHWKRNDLILLLDYPIRSSQNEGYKTFSCCVPIEQIGAKYWEVSW